jgi:hypothetical protein
LWKTKSGNIGTGTAQECHVGSKYFYPLIHVVSLSNIAIAGLFTGIFLPKNKPGTCLPEG